MLEQEKKGNENSGETRMENSLEKLLRSMDGEEFIVTVPIAKYGEEENADARS